MKNYTNRISYRLLIWLCASFMSWICTSCHCGKAIQKDGAAHEEGSLAGTYPIQITITQTSNYCGGAAPPDELLNDLLPPKPLGDFAFFIRKGKTNIVAENVIASGKTNSEGLCHLQLPEGDYALVFADKKDKVYYNKLLDELKNGNENFAPIDKNCLEKWLATPELIFTVSKDGPNRFEINVHHHCPWNATPCAQYIGPLPP